MTLTNYGHKLTPQPFLDYGSFGMCPKILPLVLKILYDATIETVVTKISLNMHDIIGNQDEFCFHHENISNLSSASILFSIKYVSNSFFWSKKLFSIKCTLKASLLDISTDAVVCTCELTCC